MNKQAGSLVKWQMKADDKVPQFGKKCMMCKVPGITWKHFMTCTKLNDDLQSKRRDLA